MGSTIVVPDAGEAALLRLLLIREDTAGLTWSLRLFANDYVPHRESVIGDFTEATFPGYAPKTLARATWTNPAPMGGVAVSYYGSTAQSWLSSSSSQTVYGWYVTDSGGTVALFAARFATPITVTTTVPASVRPWMRLRSMSEPTPP